MSCALELERVSGTLVPMSYCCGVSLPAHILYSDDVLICCIGMKKNVCCLLRVFTSYYEALGRLVNFDKRKLFTWGYDYYAQTYACPYVRVCGWFHSFLLLGLPYF